MYEFSLCECQDIYPALSITVHGVSWSFAQLRSIDQRWGIICARVPFETAQQASKNQWECLGRLQQRRSAASPAELADSLRVSYHCWHANGSAGCCSGAALHASRLHCRASWRRFRPWRLRAQRRSQPRRFLTLKVCRHARRTRPAGACICFLACGSLCTRV
jgi:hypothetical protein